MRLLRLGLVGLLLAVGATHGYQIYQSKIPNGDKVTVDGTSWPGVGHERVSGGGPRSPFGQDFEANGKKWTASLCEKDSDSDGVSNGAELGDPNCVWTEGSQPQFDVGICECACFLFRFLLVRIGLYNNI